MSACMYPYIPDECHPSLLLVSFDACNLVLSVGRKLLVGSIKIIIIVLIKNIIIGFIKT
jgi:hypothetical protein